MSLSVRKFNSQQNIFTSSPQLNKSDVNIPARPKRTLMECRYKRDEFVHSRDKAKAFSGAVLGTLIPMLIFSKMQKKNLWNMKYGFNEMASMSIGANIGSIAMSANGKRKKEKEKKFNEGVFQILNSVLPMAMVDGSLKLCDKVGKRRENIPLRIAASLMGVLAGTQLGIKLSNKITDPKDIIPDRKYTAKDALANVDDAVSILVLAKVPFANKIHIDKALPFIYSYSGYRSGTSN